MDHSEFVEFSSKPGATVKINYAAAKEFVMSDSVTKEYRWAIVLFTLLVWFGFIAGVALIFSGRYVIGPLLSVFAITGLRDGLRMTLQQALIKTCISSSSYYCRAYNAGVFLF